MQYGAQTAEQYDLSSLRIMASTGEPWNPDSWSWVFEHVGKGRVPLINYSGGTGDQRRHHQRHGAASRSSRVRSPVPYPAWGRRSWTSGDRTCRRGRWASW